MKNAMKKLFSLMLVAVLLVSALPFQVGAETTDNNATALTVPVDVYVMKPDSSTSGPHRKSLEVAVNATVLLNQETARRLLADNKENRLLERWEKAGTVVTNDQISYGGLMGLPAEDRAAYKLDVWVREAETPAVHVCNFSTETITTPATCTSTGVKTLTCACGASKTETIPVAAHTPGDEATCTSPKICTVCKTQLAPKTDHTPGDPATCTHAQICTVCRTQLAAALGHNPGTNGVCTRCGETVGTMWRVEFYPNYNTNNTPHTDAVYEGTNVYSIYTPSRYGYTFAGWYYDADLTRPVPTSATITSHSAFYAKWEQVAPKEVYVRVYANGNTNNVYAIVDLYEWAQDKVITKADVQAAVAKYGIKANNDAGLSTYGPFTPAQWNSYCLDDYYRNPTEKVNVEENEKTVIYAMVHNVQTSTSSSSGSKADSSNPKTGDMIFAPMMVLGASASALAALYYISKKRAI